MPATPPILVHHRNAETYDRLLRAAIADIDLVATSDEATFLKHLPEAEILIALSLSPEAAARAARLRWIQAASSGVERFMPARQLLGQVPVTNARGIHSELMADYVLATMVMAQWDFPRLMRDQAARKWRRESKRPLAGTRLGMVGLGPVGREIARRAVVFGQDVIGVRKSSEPVPGLDTVYPADRLDEVLPDCDFVVLALPATDATHHLIGPPQLAAMKTDAVLINISRGSLVDEPALIQALRAGAIGGAVLDVFSREPLPTDSPLWAFENVIMTPHISGMRTNYEEQLADLFIDNLGRFLAGRTLRNTVDLQRGY